LKNLRFYYAKRIHEVLLGLKDCQNTFIVPVPPRKGKLRRQGWDQISLLARTLNISYGYKITPVLTRLDSVQQKYLSLDERRHHLVHSMKTVKKAARRLEGAGRLILLDDVLTSGATLSACVSLLKDCSPAPVMGMVLCAVL
jgi:predicted amidophosphoribosyltransferase